MTTRRYSHQQTLFTLRKTAEMARWWPPSPRRTRIKMPLYGTHEKKKICLFVCRSVSFLPPHLLDTFIFLSTFLLLLHRFSCETSEAFTMDALSGRLTTTGPLDRENTAMYILIIQADDGSHVTTMEVTVVVDDRDDNGPAFAHATVTRYIPDSAGIGKKY